MRALSILLVLALSGCGATGGQPVGGRSPATTVISTSGNGSLDSGGITSVRTIEEQRVVTSTVPARSDLVWSVLPQVFQELQIPVGTMDTQSRTMGNTRLVYNGRIAGRPASRFFNCGTGPFGDALADSYQLEMGVLVTLTPRDDMGTDVATRVDAQAANRATGGAAVSCSSTGRLEKLIADAVQLRAAAAG